MNDAIRRRLAHQRNQLNGAKAHVVSVDMALANIPAEFSNWGPTGDPRARLVIVKQSLAEAAEVLDVLSRTKARQPKGGAR